MAGEAGRGDLDGVGMEAARFIVAERRTIMRLMIAPVLLSALLWLAIPENDAGAAAGFVLDLAIYTVFAMSIHRFALLGEIAPLPPIDKRVFIFALWVIAESLVIAVAAVGGMAPFFIMRMMALDGQAFLTLPFLGLGVVIGFSIALYVSARFIAVFPHVAVTPRDKVSISAALSLTEGEEKPIILRLLVFSLASYGAGWALTLVFEMAGLYGPVGIIEKLFYFPLAVIENAFAFALIAFLVALASFIYRRLTDGLQDRLETAPAIP